MSTNQTTNLGLHVWEPGDDFLREEFNENFAALDGAVRVVTGSYTGNGNSSQKITLGFQPKAVIIGPYNGFYGNNLSVYSGLFAPELNLGSTYAKVVSTGFTVYATTNSQTNSTNTKYHYIAFY